MWNQALLTCNFFAAKDFQKTRLAKDDDDEIGKLEKIFQYIETFDYFLFIEIFFPDSKKKIPYIEMDMLFSIMENHCSPCIVFFNK